MLPLSTQEYFFRIHGKIYQCKVKFYKTVTVVTYIDACLLCASWSTPIRLYGRDRYRNLADVIKEHIDHVKFNR